MKTLRFLLLAVLIPVSFGLFSQGVVISNNAGDTPDGSAILEVKSTDKGLLIPRMSTAQRISIATPTAGLLVFDTDKGSFYLYGKDRSGANSWLDLSTDAGLWTRTASNVFLSNSTDNVGVGTSIPDSKFVIKADGTRTADDILFEVQDASGHTVFAVTSVGARVYVKEESKGSSSGFAVGLLGTAKDNPSDEYFRVTPDSVRVYIDDVSDKGKAGGFAVGLLSTAKGTNPNDELLRVTSDSTRIYIKDTHGAKGTAKGFAVGLQSTAKGTGDDLLQVMSDSTRVYTKQAAKGSAGGFAVGLLSTAKGLQGNYMYMLPDNYFIGHHAGEDLQNSPYTGIYNTFFGYESGQKSQSASNNVFVGHQTGKMNLYGQFNVFLGNQAGMKTTGDISDPAQGSRNVFLGYNAGFENQIGGDNVLLGFESGYNLQTAGNNISIGSQAGYSNTNNSNNIFIGRQAGYKHVGTGPANSANNNIFVGLQAGYGDAVLGNQGHNNIFIGTEAGKSNALGSINVFIGNSSGTSNTYGDDNVFLGLYSGAMNTTGDDNTFLGTGAGNLNVTGSNNVFMGVGAGQYHDLGESNVYIGNSAGKGTVTGMTPNGQGEDNVFIGTEAGMNNSTGYQNTYLGKNAGRSNTTNFGNVYLGSYAGEENTKSGNTFVGMQAGRYADAVGGGASNTFVGYTAGRSTYGSFNTTVGMSSGVIGESGQDNTYLGHTAGYNTPHGDGNVYVGKGAGYGSAVGGNPGSDNVYLGKSSGYNSTGSGNVFIGKDAGFSETGSNLLYIENSSSASPLIYGNFTANTLQINGTFTFNAGTNSVSMPTTRGTNGYVLTTNGAGSTSWTNTANLDGDWTVSGSNMYSAVSGNVGIGTTSPDCKLDIEGTGGDALKVYHGTNGHGLVVDPWNSTISAVNIDPTEANQSIYFGRDIAASQWIFQSGNVGIGTTTVDTKLEVEGVIRVSESVWPTAGYGLELAYSSSVGYIQSYNRDMASWRTLRLGGDVQPVADNQFSFGSSANRWVDVWAVDGTINTSDKRMKENIKSISYGLETIKQLTPVEFTWINNPERGKKIGFIAQDLQLIIPEAVYSDEHSDILGINYAEIIPVAIKAIQEQQILIDSQTVKIENLEKQNSELEKRLSELERIIREK